MSNHTCRLRLVSRRRDAQMDTRRAMSRMDALTADVDGAATRFAQAMAVGTSRRTFMRRIMQTAFALGASAAMVGEVFQGEAQAFHTYPCGDSPICPKSQGGYLTGNVCPSPGKPRCYAGSTCTSSSCNKCWLAGSWLCCDCCYQNVSNTQPGHTRRSCSGCGSGLWYRCINVYRCC